MADEQVATIVERQSVWTSGTAMQVGKYADLGDQPAGGKWHPPDLIGSSHRDEQKTFLRIDHDAVRTRNRVDQAGEATIRCELPDPASRIMHPGLALVGEIEIA